jgi:hypothetical protein
MGRYPMGSQVRVNFGRDISKVPVHQIVSLDPGRSLIPVLAC